MFLAQDSVIHLIKQKIPSKLKYRKFPQKLKIERKANSLESILYKTISFV